MTIQELNGKSVCILGFGLEGRANLAAMRQFAPEAEITVADANAELEIPGVSLQTGEHYLERLERFDAVIKTPGLNYRRIDAAAWPKLTSGTQIFMDTVRAAGATTIGVTGTKGKSTTSSLIAALLQAGGKRAYLVGNIGKPMMEYLAEAGPETIFVMELSGHQLERLTASPTIAVVVSFFPEHLDFFGTVEAYFEAKATIGRYQRPEDWFFYNEHSSDCRRMADLSRAGHKVGFGPGDCPVDITQTQLLGQHNAGNMAVAYMIAKQLGAGDETSIPALKSFRGLPHRLEFLGQHHGIEWIDDTISTTPESVMAGMIALDGRLGCMVLGGQDRGLTFDELGEAIVRSGIAGVILFGESGERIGAAIKMAGDKLGHEMPLHRAVTMADVIETAVRITPSGKICLLSPASPSYDMYKNFEAKGEAFAEAIRAYKK